MVSRVGGLQGITPFSRLSLLPSPPQQSVGLGATRAQPGIISIILEEPFLSLKSHTILRFVEKQTHRQTTPSPNARPSLTPLTFLPIICPLILFKVLLFNKFFFEKFYVAKPFFSFMADNLYTLQEEPAQF